MEALVPFVAPVLGVDIVDRVDADEDEVVLESSETAPVVDCLLGGLVALDGSTRANGRDVTFPDGRRLFAGSSGTGAPLDGRDKAERAPKN